MGKEQEFNEDKYYHQYSAERKIIPWLSVIMLFIGVLVFMPMKISG